MVQRSLLGAFVLLGATISFPTWADEPAFHPIQSALACANPRATLALANPADSRRTDPGWVAYVVHDGRCAKLGPDVHVRVVGQNGTLSQIEYPIGSGQTLYIQSVNIQADDLPPIVSPPSQWEAVSHDTGRAATCEVQGHSDFGTLTMNAQADRPGIVRVFLNRSVWHLPSGTPVQASVSFSDGTVLMLSGTGRDDTAAFDLRSDNLRPWVHEFTAAKSAAIRLAYGSESPWRLDLHGTSAAVSAMSECIKAAGTIDVPPPFTPNSTQPVVATEAAPQSPPPPSIALPSPAVIGSTTSQAAIPTPPPNSGASEIPIARWAGQGMMTTRPFHVDGPWELRWHSTGYFSATLHSVDQGPDHILANQSGGSSSAYQPNGGTFYIEFSSLSDWSAEAVSLPEVAQPGVTTGGSSVPQNEILASAQDSAAVSHTSQPLQTGAEQALIAVVNKYAEAYSDAQNDMLRGATRPARAKELCSILRGLSVSNWTGSIYKLSSNNDGKGVIELQIDKNTYVQTWNNALSDVSDETLIPTESPLFERVSHLTTGQAVTFSGTFIPDPEDCIKESSLSVGGAMREPEFIMRFSDIQPSQ